MRTVATALAFAAIVLAPVGASAGVTPGCQDAIAAGGAKFAKAALKIGQRCAIRGGAGAASRQPAAGGLTGNPAVHAGHPRPPHPPAPPAGGPRAATAPPAH